MVREDKHADFGTFVRSSLGCTPGERRATGYLGGRGAVLHAMASSAGYETVGPGYDWDGLKRGTTEFALVQVTLSGRGRMTWQGETYEVLPGQAMLLHFPDANRYWVAAGETWEHCYCCLHGREVLRAWRTATAALGPLVRLEPGHPLLAAHLACCRAVLDGGLGGDPFTVSALAYAVAMQVLALRGATTLGERHDGIEAAKAWGRQHAHEDIGVADLARIAGLSRHHFSRRFTAQEGLSPIAWLTDQRLRLATRLLRETDLGLAAIAARCGYADAAYFCRVFRRGIGVSPGDFRSSGMY